MLTPEIEKTLAGVSDPLSQLESIKQDIESGAVQAYKIDNGSLLVICRERTDLLVIAYVGIDAKKVTEICIEIARQSSLKNVRFHTGRKGLARLLKAFEPELIQEVYRIPVL